MSSDLPWFAGVDGCRAGWLVVFLQPSGAEVRIRIEQNFAAIVGAPERPEIVAVDIPIGLPQRVGHGGREAENAVRPLLGARQSSVFSVPSRAAIYAPDYGAACRIAFETSAPPRKVSRQLYMLAPKIREVDTVLRDDTALAARVYEVHPELAFWRLNGERALDQPKKVRSTPYAPGLALRRALLTAAGLPAAAVASSPPHGAAADDLLDALACAAIARRIHARLARSFPPEVRRDEFGLPMAIWA